MKKTKIDNITASRLISKSEYAREIKSNPTEVQRMINRGELTIVVAKGAELIYK